MRYIIEIEDLDNLLTQQEAAAAEQVVNAVLEREQFPYDCFVSISVVGIDEMKNVNLEQRGVDKPTDVLSFPALEFDEEYHLAQQIGAAELEPETGTVYLGDIVICNDILNRQAEEYGHSKRRELCYLTVHSAYHLLGYDHITEALQRDMRRKEEEILGSLGITRESMEGE